MRIGINLLHAHPGIGGGWNYICNLIQALAGYDHDNHYFAYCTEESVAIVPQQPNFTVRRIRIDPTRRLQRIFYENSFLHLHARRDRLDCLHWLAATTGLWSVVPAVVTIYDLKFFVHPDQFPLQYRVYLRWMVPWGTKRAAVLVPMSEKTADDLTKLLDVERDRMVVVPNPIHEQFRPRGAKEIDSFRAKYSVPPEFWLYVSHYYPHKNHERLFKAYARLKQSDRGAWPLVLRGEKKGAEALLARWIKEARIEQDVIWLPRLEQGEMPVLYSAASALVFPSLYEGGGIPVMEAMSCGCPVVASDIPTTREFAGDAAVLFDPEDLDSITGAMRELMNSSNLRFSLKERGLRTAQKHDPGRVAEELIKAYSRAAGGHRMWDYTP